MKTWMFLLGITLSCSGAFAVTAERGATLSVSAAVVCGKGNSTDEALNDLNLKLADQNGVEIDNNGVKLKVNAPFTVSAPVSLPGYGPYIGGYAPAAGGMERAEGKGGPPVVTIYSGPQICVTVTSSFGGMGSGPYVRQ